MRPTSRLQEFSIHWQKGHVALFDFIKEAGEKLLNPGNASTSSSAQQSSRSGNVGSAQLSVADKSVAANAVAGDAILDYIKSQNLDATALTVTYDGTTGTATVYGVAKDQATKEKIILCCGNVSSISHVDDRMSVEQASPQAKFYTVKDSYGDANQYTKIFEANRPMLKSSDKIYPDQTLRIPQA